MASIAIKSIVLAAQALARAGRWPAAVALLDGVEPVDAAEAEVLAGARAETEVDHAFWTRRNADATVLAIARKLATDPVQVWTAEFAQLRADYNAQLLALIAGQPVSGATELAATAERMAAHAPDDVTRAYVAFYRGLIVGNLLGDDAASEAHYRAAAETQDDYVRSYALRHLGGRAEHAGRLDEAHALWRESMRLRQRAGFVPGTLAQLQLIAADTSIPDVIGDWASELGIDGWFTPSP